MMNLKNLQMPLVLLILTLYSWSSYAVVQPSMAEYMTRQDLNYSFKLEEEAVQILAPLHLTSKDIIFLPVNDNETVKSGGSHWSLLVFDRNKSRFEHYDSMKNYHDEVAHNVFMKFSKHVVRKNSAFDCGVYVMKIAEELCRTKVAGKNWDASDLNSKVIASYRHQIKSLIDSLTPRYQPK